MVGVICVCIGCFGFDWCWFFVGDDWLCGDCFVVSVDVFCYFFLWFCCCYLGWGVCVFDCVVVVVFDGDCVFDCEVFCWYCDFGGWYFGFDWFCIVGCVV